MAVARLIRELHDVTQEFLPWPGGMWRLPVHEPVEVVCHNDIAPYNTVWDGDKIVGLIDFDTSSPGPRVWDLGYAAYRFVPLIEPDAPGGSPGVEQAARRLRVFCSAYGRDTDVGLVVRAAIDRLLDLTEYIRSGVAAGDPARTAMAQRGDADRYRRDAGWIHDNVRGSAARHDVAAVSRRRR